MRTSNWVSDPGFQLSPFACTAALEIERPRGQVPHHLPGTNQYLGEFAGTHGLPFDTTRGGSETMYPEYAGRLRPVTR